MKKNIFSVFVALAFFTNFAKAQQTQVAVLHPDGSISKQIVAESGKNENAAKSESIAPAANDRHTFLHHEAVLNTDGSQEMHLTDEFGKVTVISAAKGESIQKKYVEYLVKNHLPCACSSASTKAESIRTATLPANNSNQR
jgi:hypothetical protein